MATFVTYDTRPPAAGGDQRWIVAAGFASAAAAQAAAVAAGANVAHHAAAVSDDAEPGLLLDIAGDHAGTVQATLRVAADTARRRAATWRLHAALRAWSGQLTREGAVHPASVVAVGHDFLFRAHQAAYLMAHRNLLAVAQFEDWAGKMAMGAADVVSPATFFQRMEAGGGLAAPNVPCAWVRWGNTQQEGYATAVRVPLAQAVAASGAVTVQAPGNLALDAADLPAGGIDATGSWIDSLP